MYKVIKAFRDKYSKKLYVIGDSFTSEDPVRITDLVNRKLIEGVSDNGTPLVYETMTRNEIVELIDQKGIEYNKRFTKPELIQLLIGGD